ncbi:SAF domain-containing protein [Thermoanaerobacterium butyriciformans]|uniref:Flp pilus assembly protein CpaB n=1 Tax=Thermoanaerobacterium butyriciformans TaxID=1702242 RepID=A0ABS4NB03_9THEO|nr:SAF domain-containing protein [Thermoanaerobacterium butyriciformans]MBP2070843.1 Flp pilus assembly protein CpaB [Thermoanaerobacterium butyriciformans]
MKSKIFKLAILPALIVLVITFVIISTQTSTSTVVIAKANISSGTIITNDNVNELLTTKTVPTSNVPEGVIKSTKDALNKKINVTRLKGDYIFKSTFQEAKTELKTGDVLIPVEIPASLKDFIAGNSVLTVQTLSNSPDVQAQTIEDLKVETVINVNDSSGKHIYAILKTTKDKAVALAPFLSNKSYQVIVEK